MTVTQRGAVRHALGLGIAAAVVIGMVGCAPATETAGDDGELRTISIGYSARAPFVLPALMAEAGTDEFSSRGLTFEGQLISAPDALSLLATGKLDVFAGPVSAGMFNAIGADSDIQIVAPGGSSTNPSNWYISNAALGGAPYSLEDWRGKTVYTSTGLGSYVMISLAHELATVGLKPTDLEFAQIPPDDVAPALTSGAIFAGIPASVAVRQELLAKGDIFEGPSAVYPAGISPAFIFFGASLIKDDPELALTILEAFADLQTNTLQGDYVNDPDMAALIADILDYKVEDVPRFVTFSYPVDLSFPAGWTQNAESVWRELPDVLSYKGSVADRVIAKDLIAQALKNIGK